MVGDRVHDVDGARAHGLGCLGAGWGYGPPGELESAGALAVHATPVDLHRALLGRPAGARARGRPHRGRRTRGR
jgi:phosphoglycolate phosphatase